MIPLKISILEHQEQLHDVKMECFTEIQKMADKVKMMEKQLEILYQVNQRMRFLQVKIDDLDKWTKMKKIVPSILPIIKSYDIDLHTLATTEYQDLTSRFEENARQNLAGMMELYEKSIYDIQRYIQWPEINLEDEHLVPFSFFQKLEDRYENIKAEVQTKEVISKEYVQELLVKPSMEYSHYAIFMHKFVISMEKFKKCNLALDVKKAHIFNS